MSNKLNTTKAALKTRMLGDSTRILCALIDKREAATQKPDETGKEDTITNKIMAPKATWAEANLTAAEVTSIIHEARVKHGVEMLPVWTQDVRFEVAKAIAARCSELTLRSINLDAGWELDGQIPMSRFFAMVNWAVLGNGNAFPKAFVLALAEDRVRYFGNPDAWDNRFPFFFRDIIPAGTVADAANPAIIKLVGRKGISKEIAKLLTKAGNVFTAEALMTQFVKESVITEDSLEVLMLLMGAKVEDGAWVCSRTRERFEVKRVEREAPYMHTYAFNNRVVRGNTLINGCVDGVLDQNKLSIKTVAFMAGYSLSATTNKGCSGRQAYTTDAFEETENGAVWSSLVTAVKRGKVGVLRVTPGFYWTLTMDNGTQADRVTAMNCFAGLGLPAMAQHQLNWVVVGSGAEAMGVGRRGSALVMFADQDKPEKLLNRFALGIKPTAWSADLVDSAFQLQLSNGQVVTQKGRKYNAAYVFSPLVNEGSGEVILDRDTWIPVGRKGVNYVFEFPLGMGLTDEDVSKIVADQFKAPATVLNGGTLASWCDDEVEKFKVLAAIFTKTGQVHKYDPQTGLVKITVTGDWVYDSQAEKLVGFGFKGRTKIRTGVSLSVEGNPYKQPQLLFGGEVMKGMQLLVTMWAEHTNNGVVYDPNTGLTPAQQAEFDAWIQAHTIALTVRMKFEETEYRRLKRLHYGKSDFKFYPSSWEIAHTTTAVVGDIVLGTEVSTNNENEGRQAFFPETLLGVDIVDDKLGSSLWEDKLATRKRDALVTLVDMVTVTPHDKCDVVEDAIEIGSDIEIDDLPLYRHGVELMRELAKAKPHGFTIEMGTEEIYVHPNALLALGASSNGGTLTGAAQTLLALLRAAANPVAKRSGSYAGLLSSHMNLFKGALDKQLLHSPGTLAKVGRTAKDLYSRKVATTTRFEVKPWELHINPLDPLVTSGAFNPGDLTLDGRVPMIFFSPFRVVLDWDTSIGVFEVAAFCWATSTEGDADGDGIVSYNCGQGPDADRIERKFKAHMFGYKGYYKAYGHDIEDMPYGDFLVIAEKKNPHGSKMYKDGKLVWNAGCVELYDHKVTETLADGTTIEKAMDGFLTIVENVGNHYSTIVGRTYGIATNLLYGLYQRTANNRNGDYSEFIDASIWAWRILHEKFSLGGYTPSAKVFHEKLEKLAKEGALTIARVDGDITLEDGEAVKYLVDTYLNADGSAFKMAFTEEMGDLILQARQTAMCASDLEAGRSKVRHPHLREFAIAATFTRRVSKGLFAAPHHGHAPVINGHTMADLISSDMIKAWAPGLWGKILTAALAVHGPAVRILRDKFQDPTYAKRN